MAELKRLPLSEGSYGGSMWPQPPWVYLGSEANYHHFRYTYTINNGFYQRVILIPRQELILPFEKPLAEGYSPGATVYPLIADKGKVYGFTLTNTQTFDADWLHFSATPPTFEKQEPIKSPPLSPK